MVPSTGLKAGDLVIKRHSLCIPQLMGKEQPIKTESKKTLLYGEGNTQGDMMKSN